MTACASLACSNKIHMNFVLHASDEHTRPGNEVRSSPHNPAHHTTNGDTIDLACSMFPSHLSFTLLILCFLCFLKSLTSSSTFLSHCHSLVCTLYTKLVYTEVDLFHVCVPYSWYHECQDFPCAKTKISLSGYDTVRKTHSHAWTVTCDVVSRRKCTVPLKVHLHNRFQIAAV